jgi:hypothetical protein
LSRRIGKGAQQCADEDAQVLLEAIRGPVVARGLVRLALCRSCGRLVPTYNECLAKVREGESLSDNYTCAFEYYHLSIFFFFPFFPAARESRVTKTGC